MLRGRTVPRWLHVIALFIGLSLAPRAAMSEPGLPGYLPRVPDPTLEELKQRWRTFQSQRDEATEALRAKQRAQQKAEKEGERRLRARLPEDQRPSSLETFQRVPHHPPVAQFMTGTCWAFATTSMMEAEAERRGGARVKLSEMHTVYWEYVRKVRGYVRRRGEQRFGEGSESNAVLEVWARHGAMPAKVYSGLVSEDPRHDHQRLAHELRELVDFVKREELWEEELVVSLARVILDRRLGRPPETFLWEGKRSDPMQFMTKTLRIAPRDYVDIMSTLSLPYFQQGKFDVPDNWWDDESYYNVPLELYYETLKRVIREGYSVSIGLDMSEPGKDPETDTLFVPRFDIPSEAIDAMAREYRFAHEVTTDDHGVHLVGWATVAGQDWYLIKDSGRSSRRGRFEGYYFLRGDYVKLKVLDFTVHRDAVRDLLARFPSAVRKAAP